MTRIVAIFAAAAVVLGVGLGVFLTFGRDGDAFAECRRGAIAGGTPDIGGPFTLTDGSGASVGFEDVATGPTLVYFGYTFCPDFCPTDLARNAVAADMLAERGVDVGQVFITIDPERDTREVVGEYADALHPDLVGLTGSPEAVADAAGAYRVYYEKAGDDPDYYLMNHSTFTYLVAPDHPFLEFYGSDAAPEQIAESVACFADEL